MWLHSSPLRRKALRYLLCFLQTIAHHLKPRRVALLGIQLHDLPVGQDESAAPLGDRTQQSAHVLARGRTDGHQGFDRAQEQLALAAAVRLAADLGEAVETRLREPQTLRTELCRNLQKFQLGANRGDLAEVSNRAVLRSTELADSRYDVYILRMTGRHCEDPPMSESEAKRALLRHFLAALAYRTQKALRGAPPAFAFFNAGNKARAPKELLRHMTSVLGYARTFFAGGTYRAEPLDSMEAEIARFHNMLAQLGTHLVNGSPLHGITEEQLLQGPFADAMTHAGQLALLRRLAGVPVPPENFGFAEIRSNHLGEDQAEPVSPDAEWPERLA
jgi:hypothetical protein